MKIQVRLHGALSRYRPASTTPLGTFELEVADGATVEAVIEQLGIPTGWARGLFVNERPSEPGDPLASGDQLVLFPPVSGGTYRTPQDNGTCSRRRASPGSSERATS